MGDERGELLCVIIFCESSEEALLLLLEKLWEYDEEVFCGWFKKDEGISDHVRSKNDRVIPMKSKEIPNITTIRAFLLFGIK